MHTVLVVIQVVVAVAVVGLILLQQGKGADAGAAFGSGASGTVFGARGAANFLSRATAVLATVFFLVSLTLAYLVSGRGGSGGDSVVEKLSEQPAATQPAEPVVPAAPETPVADPPKTPVVPEQ
jgi:preprotein translocase subunit SecG